ncbi:MAG TPA: hypothetical protein VN849_11745, partial [Stellaceae bacterium]|nr:hypothetical protein [Stellaceae bacterium]
MPLLSLWTGMRLNECAQVRTDDMAVMDGVDVILIHEDEEGDKLLKTDVSERFVPIRSELKQMGFLNLCHPKGKRVYYSDPFQKWCRRFLTSIGAKTPKTSFHSFRHCY